ncbi:S-adenosyl-L-methionine-dependent methyltransferase [Lentinus brumalis]|uniref:Cytosine-specific methyltransferase n=1 Tax=Lentinus brumalis TaxID=2498619 RepID=A0A371DF05_9APHY|nr:S-adenosyl-L-methionine-dependent methyltransferase [Polyporus brumalis]
MARSRHNEGSSELTSSVPHSSASICRGKRRSRVDPSSDKSPDADSSQTAKKRRRTVREAEHHITPSGGPGGVYEPSPDDNVETNSTIVFGEDPLERHDLTDKPVRILHDYVVFDPLNDFEFIPLDFLDDASQKGRGFEAAGFVAPLFLDDDDDAESDEEDSVQDLPRLRTSAIWQYSIDYTTADDPLYIETTWAFYVLASAEASYRPLHTKFYRPHRIAQLVISAAKEGSLSTFPQFEETYVGAWDPLLEEHIQMQDIIDAVPLVRTILEQDQGLGDSDVIVSSPFVQHMFALVDQRASPEIEHSIPPPRTSLGQAIPPLRQSGNADLAVLRADRQTPIHVTPFIDDLARGLFHEPLQVIGPPTKRPTAHDKRRRQRAVREHLVQMIGRSRAGDTRVQFPRDKELDDEYWEAVVVGDVMYQVGDCILIERGPWRDREYTRIPDDLAQVPEDAVPGDYLWFAQILYIHRPTTKIHIRFFEHSSKSYLHEFSCPDELFLTPYCGTIDPREIPILACVKVRYPRFVGDVEAHEYFCRLIYDDRVGSFTDIDHSAMAAVNSLPPPSCCPVCQLKDLTDGHEYLEIEHGFIYVGKAYHENDYVLLRGESLGPASIGRIVTTQKIVKDGKPWAQVTIAYLGRTVDLGPPSRPMLVDERELFLTKKVMIEIDIENILQCCVVLHHDAVQDLRSWLDESPLHFYVKCRCRSVILSWSSLTQISPGDVEMCQSCHEDQSAQTQQLEMFSKQAHPLRGLDLFGGTGAFGLSMEQTSPLKITHAVEISPSAADTMRKASPHATVYNQCTNLVLKYAIRYHAGQRDAPLRDIRGIQELSPPPVPGQIDCIVAGFPCQSFSSLNRFKHRHTRRNHLMLNLASWVDFLRPKYCFLENVRGFMSYNLHASDGGKYDRAEGEITKGGLKFLVSALIAMGYQVRFGLLQAGHYGAPQGRVRFILIASQATYPLPNLPQPTHHSLNPDSLQIKFTEPERLTLQPIPMQDGGTAPFKHVSIHDAIGDLLNFDWEHPKEPSKFQRSGVLSVRCDPSQSHWGPLIKKNTDMYKSGPQTTFQAKCRVRAPKNPQHYTRTFKPAVVERTLHVSKHPNADYRDLPASLWDYQLSSPLSAIGRKGFPPGFYGRPDKSRWFHTISTNLQPTARQSYVLHGDDGRIFTVREFARAQGFPDWFEFVAHNNKVDTMHRQIGNAVPWQLGEALGRELREAMFRRWLKNRGEAIIISDSDSDE